MRIFQLLLPTIVTFLATSTDISVVGAQATIVPNMDNVLRTSRVTPMRGYEEDVHGDGNDDSEERNYFKDISTKFITRVWLELGFSKDFVKKQLKLSGLEGTALTSNKNYKFYEIFEGRTEKYMMINWLKEDVTTFQVWKKLGMEHVTLDQLGMARSTKPYRMYQRYVLMFDKDTIASMRVGHYTRGMMVSRDASEVEMTARAQIMGVMGRDDEYVKKVLGLTVDGQPGVPLKGIALTKHSDYKYYEIFLKVKKAHDYLY